MIETLTTLQWLCICFSAICIGMSKTGIQGITVLSVPFMAMAFGAKESTGIILPMLCMADIIGVWYYKKTADWKVVIKLLPTAVIGFFIAVYVDTLIPAKAFKQLLGWTLVLVFGVMLWNEFKGKQEGKWVHTWWYATFFGLLGGFVTMVGNAAGPVMSVYLLSMRKKKLDYLGTNAWFFMVINLLKVPLQIFTWGNISWPSFQLNLLMLPFIGLGALIAIRVVKRLNEHMFRRFIQAITAASVVLMLIQ